MCEVELSLNGTLREIFSFRESRAAFDRFLPSMCVMAEAQRYRSFGHKAVHRSTAKSHRFSKFLASKTSILH